MNNTQLIESLEYHTNRISENVYIPNSDEEVVNHPLFKKITKLTQNQGGRLTTEQSTSIIALSILIKYKDRNSFSKRNAIETFKHEFPKWTIGTGILATIFNLMEGGLSIPIMILSFLANGLIYGSIATGLEALVNKNSAKAYYDWAEQWAIDHDWFDKNGNLKQE